MISRGPFQPLPICKSVITTGCFVAGKIKVEIAEAIQRQSKGLYGNRGCQPPASSDVTRSARDHSSSRHEWF